MFLVVSSVLLSFLAISDLRVLCDEDLDQIVRSVVEKGWPQHVTVYEHLGNRLLRHHETSPVNTSGATFEIEKPLVLSMGTLRLDNQVEQYNFNKFRATGFHLKQGKTL